MCEFCENGKPIITIKVGTFGTHNEQYLDIKIDMDEIKTIYRNEYKDIGNREETTEGEIGERIKICACPMCGRDLSEVSENGK